MDIHFAPFIDWPYIAVLAAISALIIGLFLYLNIRGTWLRALAMSLLLLAVYNPILLNEERQSLTTIVPIIVDKSQSQLLPNRPETTNAALSLLTENLSKYQQIEPRIVTVNSDNLSDAPSTKLLEELSSVISDVPPSRIGGAILLTDGQVHDIPPPATDIQQILGFNAPLHALITGKEDEHDRRIEIVQAPRFGIVNEELLLKFRVLDDGRESNDRVAVAIHLNGESQNPVLATVGEITEYAFSLPSGGNNIIEFSVDSVDGELTPNNNRTVRVIDGIRQNLRVLLVSGEPHSGERSWRNLLKSDPSVDLVHFTILRSPERIDGTPTNELSLIAFPTTQLFIEKINDFDLIVLDRFQHNGVVMPIVYYDFIAQYVDQGGALLIASGPELAGSASLAYTPLNTVMPAIPTGEVTRSPFYPRLSQEGTKHPITRGLEGSTSEPPNWGRWFRSVDVDILNGQTIMEGADKAPLLIVNRQNEGRIAMLLSDQGWLWARGFEGGGPYSSLYRRIAHWLMKEPELEEEALKAKARGRQLEITRQTVEGDPGAAKIRSPSGKELELSFTEKSPGLYTIEQTMDEIGLYEISNGSLEALAHVGAVDSPEFKGMISTKDKLAPLVSSSFGSINRILDENDKVSIPPILPMRGDLRTTDNDRLRIKMTGDTTLKALHTTPLFAGFAGLGALLLAISAIWWREGR